MLASLYERICQWFDQWQLDHPKRWWMWWRADSREWALYEPHGRKIHDHSGSVIDGPCMRRARNGRWEYRTLTPAEENEYGWWQAIR